MMVSGVLLIADAAVTLAWQEPISAFMASREQDQLGDDLEAQAATALRDKLETRSIRDVKRRIARLAELDARRTDEGDAMGRIVFPTLDDDYAFVEGTGLDVLRKGPGHYPKTSFPGAGGTVAIAGHRTTYGAPFRDIDKLKAGQHIEIEMPYGTLEYKVEKKQIVAPDATWVTDRVKGAERLVLSACHPLYSAAQRIVVFARLVDVRID